MNCDSATIHNPVERFVSLFPTIGAAATAAGVTTEMLRQMRRRGFVSTRDRALHMAGASEGRVTAAELLAVAEEERAH